MDLKTFQSKAIRTNKWLGDSILLRQLQVEKRTPTVEQARLVYCRWDTAHMLIGMSSELSELMDAIRNMDTINIQEEVGDIMWYVSNEASMQDISIVAQTDVDCFYMQHLTHAISEYSDFCKKVIIYGKPYDKAKRAELLQRIVTVCYNFSAGDGVFGSKIDLPSAMGKIIAKLEERYPDSFYTDEAAINRDLNAERKALEEN